MALLRAAVEPLTKLMKEVILYSNFSIGRETVPTCDTCKHRGKRVDMLTPDVMGTVDYCKKTDGKLVFPKRCKEYEKNIRTAIADFISNL